MSAVAVRTVRDGKNVLRFHAEVLGDGTSERLGVPRWSELTVYRLGDRQYLVSKVGRSTLAHRPECSHANPRRMLAYAVARDEALVRRTACPECQPAVDNTMDPHTLLEATRYTVLQAHSPEQLIEVLVEGRTVLPEIVQDVMRQVCKSDTEVAQLWALEARS
jgi:hypothetical protein